MKKTSDNAYASVLFLLAIELLASLLIVIVYLIIGAFTYRVITGVLLGSLITVGNFFALTLAVNRAVNEFLTLRGEGEMTEEEAEEFSAAHVARIQNVAKTSYVIRTFMMLGALVVAFLLDVFDPLATAIPLLLFRPALMLEEYIRRRKGDKDE